MEVLVERIAAGGEGVGHLADGRVVFVRGAIPGDRALVEVTEERARFARAEVRQVLDPGPGRVAPPCPLVAEGCGGCGWQHVEPGTQRRLKAAIVTDALTRIGRLPASAIPPIDDGPALAENGFRTTVRAAVDGGVAALRVHHGHETVALGTHGCLVAHPLVDEVLRAGRFGSAREVTVRAGAATGERLALVDPKVGDGVRVPEDVAVVGADQLAAGHRAWIHDDVAGRRWRISAGSFFQTRADGAAVLADAVRRAVLGPGRRGDGPAPGLLVDLYAGVGLLGGVVAAAAAAAGSPLALQAVEANRSSVVDARTNLADLDRVHVVRADVRRWRPSAADAVIADPSRHGLGKDVVDRIAATGARRVVLVSCDPAALGRDAGLLVAAGSRLSAVTLVDLFPHTPHVEVVTTWDRTGGA